MQRIQKLLSNAGLYSRRQVERLIEEKKITVNGKVASLGAKATESDVIKVNNKKVNLKKEYVYYKCNKPKGYVSTCSVREKKSILKFMPKGPKLHLVGRLDKNSSGLMIFTNDGELTNTLTHPRFGNTKEYRVQTKDALTRTQVQKLNKGVALDNKKTNPIKIKFIGKNTYYFTLTEGKFQHIRRAVKKVGNTVEELQRIRIASCKLGNLKDGKTVKLTKKEVELLRKAI